MVEAERQFRAIIGYRDLTKLALAIERDLARTAIPSPTEENGAAQRRAPVAPFAPADTEEVIEAGETRFGEPGPRLSWVCSRSSLVPCRFARAVAVTTARARGSARRVASRSLPRPGG
jgi:hypothetical protein